MRTRIKICGITTREALEACIDAGVDAVGFVLAPSPRRIEPRAAGELIAGLPGLVAAVGVWKSASQVEVDCAIEEAGVRVVQADADSLREVLLGSGIRAMPVYRTGGSSFDVEPTPVILVEGQRSGSGSIADWSLIAALARKHRVVLAGGLTPTNVGEAIRQVRPFAVDVSSGVERSPGVKDPALIQAFARAVRFADRALEEVDGR